MMCVCVSLVSGLEKTSLICSLDCNKNSCYVTSHRTEEYYGTKYEYVE